MSHQQKLSQLYQDSSFATNETTFHSHPLFLLFVTAITIYTTEVLIMVLLWKFPFLPPIPQAFIDASLLLIFVFPNLYLFVFKPLRVQIEKRNRAEEEKNFLIKELRQALDEVMTLQGIIPICAACKKIRDDKGYWHQVEAYITGHSNASFSHGICPDCVEKLYPEFTNKQDMN